MYNNGFEGLTTWIIFDKPTLNASDGMTTSGIPTRFLHPASEATLSGAAYQNAVAAMGGDTKTGKIILG